MKKLIGFSKNKTSIFISGEGSNLKNLIKFSKKINSPITIELIISNTKKAKGLKYSNQYNILKKIFNFNNNIDEKKLLTLLIKKKIKFICLAGFMKILSKNFIKKFKGKIINIHPSLLPKYGGKGMYGKKIHKKVLESKDKETGITIHFVSEGYDSGEIIFQKKLKINEKDDASLIEKRIHNLEYEFYPKVIASLLET